MNGNEKFRLSHQNAIFSIRNLTDWELYTESKLSEISSMFIGCRPTI